MQRQVLLTSNIYGIFSYHLSCRIVLKLAMKLTVSSLCRPYLNQDGEQVSEEVGEGD